MKKKHYLVYQTTNLLNGKIYIGQHQTDNLNDGYIGSGIELNQDIKKFGKDNFKREILFDFDSFEEMFETYHLQDGTLLLDYTTDPKYADAE